MVLSVSWHPGFPPAFVPSFQPWIHSQSSPTAKSYTSQHTTSYNVPVFPVNVKRIFYKVWHTIFCFRTIKYPAVNSGVLRPCRPALQQNCQDAPQGCLAEKYALSGTASSLLRYTKIVNTGLSGISLEICRHFTVKNQKNSRPLKINRSIPHGRSTHFLERKNVITSTSANHHVLSCMRKMGLEPTRAQCSQDPQSCSSASSDTSANKMNYSSVLLYCQQFFEKNIKNLFLEKIKKISKKGVDIF